MSNPRLKLMAKGSEVKVECLNKEAEALRAAWKEFSKQDNTDALFLFFLRETDHTTNILIKEKDESSYVVEVESSEIDDYYENIKNRF